ncbi:hypothetical protein Pmar_PMAR003016 [Perkinsus marinus ATCC 50983]|uniref:Uncharacterized protein n=1 Tax=Perkinsus marinus (strain ATCC 50983 / TXsc) TaxID=423536 RepID=C5LR60_PERM5|nr:hypothetical protein Pmar_PMAR003016 [Perkinsus marinus ATCC 50983]EER00945.1 hypothetical protein Pmar_PMAR003016 [Perkinsus marinus ATCC 50983]|eukprot:XP_002768227.1 hypothetical protein Pmar_PMAR003016 [Perkinsus marinus ATCC 50983]
MPTTITTTAFPLWFADDDDYDNDLGRQVTSSMLEDPFVPRVAYRKPITEHQLHAIDIDGVGKRPLCSSSNRIPHKEEEDYRRFRPDGLKQLIPSCGLPILPTPPATPSSDQASSAEVNDDDERTEEEEITDGDWTLLEDVTPLHLAIKD